MGNSNHDDKEKIFVDAVGQKATVHRETMGVEKAEDVNRRLAELGLALQGTDTKLKHYTYYGSAAVHIYASKILNSVTYASQTDGLVLYSCPEIMAAKAFDDLLASMKQTYGHNRPRLRSGF